MPEDHQDKLQQLVKAAVQIEGAPQWVAHLISGVPISASSGNVDRRSLDSSSRDPQGRVARLVSHLCLEQDRLLEAVNTGPLVRVVVEAEQGAVYCLPIVRGRHLVGVLAGDGSEAAVVAADRVMIDLVNGVRRDIGLSSQNPGGLAQIRVPPSDAAPADAESDRPNNFLTVRGQAVGAESAVLTAKVTWDQVQWVSVVRDREVAVSVDCFADNVRMDRHFYVMGKEARRRFYTELAAQAEPLMNRVGRMVRPTVGGPLRRLVLDVEQGVIVLQRIGPRETLVGVTLDQDRVATVEAVLHDIVGALDRAQAV